MKKMDQKIFKSSQKTRNSNIKVEKTYHNPRKLDTEQLALKYILVKNKISRTKNPLHIQTKNEKDIDKEFYQVGLRCVQGNIQHQKKKSEAMSVHKIFRKKQILAIS